jgi:hypothetical protein
MSQSALMRVLPLGWQNYLDNQPKFAGYKKSYTTKLATDALTKLAAAQLLPDFDARLANPELTRTELVEQSREFLEVWQWLEGYIETAYPGAAYKPMRVAAGYRSYEAAAGYDWDAMVKLMDAAKQFVALHDAELAAKGDMPDDFAQRVKAEAADVETLLKRMAKETQAAATGTSERQTALLACLETYMVVSRDAQRIFLRQPKLAQLFQVEYLLDVIGGGAQAGVKGTLTLADGAPAPDVAVAVPGLKQPLTTVSDADGRYALALAAGEYVLTFGGAGYVPQEVRVTVEAGVKKRVDALMGKA